MLLQESEYQFISVRFRTEKKNIENYYSLKFKSSVFLWAHLDGNNEARMHTKGVTYMDSSGILLCAILNARDLQESNNLGFPMVLLTDNNSKVQSNRVGIKISEKQWLRARKMAQSAKCLLCKYKDLNLYLQHPCVPTPYPSAWTSINSYRLHSRERRRVLQIHLLSDNGHLWPKCWGCRDRWIFIGYLV